jgi:hypothetical protein
MVRELNQIILDMLPGQERTYFIIDSANINKADPEITELPLEILQSIYLPDLPLFKL